MGISSSYEKDIMVHSRSGLNSSFDMQIVNHLYSANFWWNREPERVQNRKKEEIRWAIPFSFM